MVTKPADENRAVATVVVPCHNENEALIPLCTCLLKALPESDFRLLLVDDGSTDGSESVFGELALRNPRIDALRLSRRYGQAAALVAGFLHCETRYAISFDADLEYAPEAINLILTKLRSGFRVVNGSRFPRREDLFHRAARGLARLIIMREISDPFCPVKGFDMSLCRHFKSTDSILNFPGLAILSLPVEVAEVQVERGHRSHGKSKYSPLRLAHLFLRLLALAVFGYLPPVKYEISQRTEQTEV